MRLKRAILASVAVIMFLAGCGRDEDYTISFDTQGGTAVSQITGVASGSAIDLPYTSRNGYTFDGWYSAASGGTLIGGAGDSYVVSGNTTLYAHWTIDTESGTTKTINGIECVLVKAGTFMMGSPTSESERDSDELQHQVTITKDYWVSKYPVTQAQYKAAMDSNPSYFSGDNRPVEFVTWDEAVAFCNKVGGRLLTEAEWEFAARGGNKSKGYIYSGSNSLDEVGWYGAHNYSGNSSFKTQLVGQKKANELGIHDMSGNVWEWVSDWYDSYPIGSVSDPTGPSSGSYRVHRGGSWFYDAQSCRVAARNYGSPSVHVHFLGLRVAFDVN